MLIIDHKLAGDGSEHGLRPEYLHDEDHRGLRPKYAIIHYAVAGSAEGVAAGLRARDYLSCHVTIGLDGKVIQQVPFNRVAYHAGKSSWKGETDLNNCTLGIELASWGPLLERGKGKLVNVYGRPYDGPAIRARHKGGFAPKSWTHWAEYGRTALDICAHICELWRQHYGIVDVLGHDDISPGRKFDPGPAFPMTWLRGAIFPNGVSA